MMITGIEAYLAAFLIGLMGAGHCLGMCGGITAALSFAMGKVSSLKKWGLLFGYNLGRIISYTSAGAIAGYLGHHIVSMGGLPILRILAGVLLVLMGLYVAGWWRVLTRLEHMGQRLWRFIKPLGDKVMPVKSLPQAVLLGAVWGWLPCGLVYSALVYAVAQGGAVSGGMIMLAFGLGTLPAVLLGGASASALKNILSKKIIQHVMGVLLCVFGAWTILIPIQHAGHDHGAHGDIGTLHEQHQDQFQEEGQEQHDMHEHHH